MNELIEELQRLKDAGWGESKICVFDEVDSIYLPIVDIRGYCGTVLIIKKNVK